MAQAERISTALRELMSRGRPRKSTTPVRAAQTFEVDSQDLDEYRRLLGLVASASLTRRRIASEREGLSGSRLAQSSICDLRAGDSRTAVTGSCPVGGRPRFFGTTGIDFRIIPYYVKPSRWEVAASHRP